MHGRLASAVIGLILILFGILFLLDQTGTIDFHFWRFLGEIWPIILVFLGAWIMYDQLKLRQAFRISREVKRMSRGIGSIELSPDAIGPDGLACIIGLGEIKIRLAEESLMKGANPIFTSAGIGEINLLIPAGVACKIHCSCGLGELNIFSNKKSGISNEHDYQDPHYDAAEKKVEITARCSIGEIKIARE